MILNSFHKDILKFLAGNEESISLMDIGKEVWLDHPQKVQDKLDQLEREGYISKSSFWWYQVIRTNEETNSIHIPFFGFAQCGNAGKSILEDEYPRMKLPINQDLINQAESNKYFITRAKWDSMEPFIHTWDFVLIKIQNWYQTEDKVLVVHNNQPKIKKIQTIENKKYLHSLNPEHGDLVIEPYADINIVGVVKKIFPAEQFSI